jgi:prepilin-type N-terminal cleavage/methylation domain-containing protein
MELASHKTIQQHGFGLIELMVCISIMGLVSALIVTRQSAFNGAVLLRNQTYEVAFALREAQLLAVSGGDDSVRRYGVAFSTEDDEQHLYRLFRDSNNNAMIDSGEQIGLTGKLDGRFEIRGLTPVSGDNVLAVTFLRPNFDADFCADLSGCPPTSFSTGPGYIDVSRVDQTGNSASVVRRVYISETGQISVVTF